MNEILYTRFTKNNAGIGSTSVACIAAFKMQRIQNHSDWLCTLIQEIPLTNLVSLHHLVKIRLTANIINIGTGIAGRYAKGQLLSLQNFHCTHAKYQTHERVVLHTKNDSATARKKLSSWLMDAEKLAFAEQDSPYALPEFKPCITAYHNWAAEILSSLEVSYSNGFTEGCNSKTKVLKRICFGFRNFERFRSRILHCSV